MATLPCRLDGDGVFLHQDGPDVAVCIIEFYSPAAVAQYGASQHRDANIRQRTGSVLCISLFKPAAICSVQVIQ